MPGGGGRSRMKPASCHAPATCCRMKLSCHAVCAPWARTVSQSIPARRQRRDAEVRFGRPSCQAAEELYVLRFRIRACIQKIETVDLQGISSDPGRSGTDSGGDAIEVLRLLRDGEGLYTGRIVRLNASRKSLNGCSERRAIGNRHLRQRRAALGCENGRKSPCHGKRPRTRPAALQPIQCNVSRMLCACSPSAAGGHLGRQQSLLV